MKLITERNHPTHERERVGNNEHTSSVGEEVGGEAS